MHRAKGTAAVRLTLWTLVFACLAMALVQPTQAGTADAPEIQDPAGDQVVLGAVPGCLPEAGCQAATRIDIISVWLDKETATQVNVNVLLSNVPTGATTATSRYRFHATFGGTEVVSEATAVGGSSPADAAPGGNTASTAIDGNTLIMTLDKSIYGAVSDGASLTGLFMEGDSLVPTAGTAYAHDRAPNSGAGTDYVFGSAGGGNATCPTGNCTAGDTDGDGLNDTCETTYFGNTTVTDNASADPDGDGLTNGQECALGTDPTKADTDGDGVNDKDDPFPTDPSKGSSNSTTTSTSKSTTGSKSSTSGSRSTTSGGGTGGETSGGSVTDLAGAIDKLQSDAGYLGMSAGGFLAVLILCIIGLAVRWSL